MTQVLDGRRATVTIEGLPPLEVVIREGALVEQRLVTNDGRPGLVRRRLRIEGVVEGGAGAACADGAGGCGEK